MLPKPVRPIPVNLNRRVQSFTPMPQVRKSNTFRPISQSPPPFDTQQSPMNRYDQLEHIYSNPSSTQGSNVALLSHGISLLSITQLRDLLRDYSLPTGGNKHVLVNRLIIFLETFGQNQQNMISQFSARLKTLLSYEGNQAVIDHGLQVPMFDTGPVNTQQPIPPSLKQQILSKPVSCLFEPADAAPLFENLVPDAELVGSSMQISLPPNDGNAIPILQFVPLVSLESGQKIMFQFGGVFNTLSNNTLWADLSDFSGRTSNLQIQSVEPIVSMCILVRWMKRVPIYQLVQRIITERAPAPVYRTHPNSILDGVCPLTRKLIARPARGMKCEHSECFDLTGYICYSLKNKSWACPICNRPLPADELCVDLSYFQNAHERVQRQVPIYENQSYLYS